MLSVTDRQARTRRALLLALLANTFVCVGEVVLGWHANSLAVLVDAVHNGADELALACLYLACARGPRATTLRGIANLLNTVGIALVALTIAGLALERLFAAPVVAGELTLAAGLAAALGNAAVALALREAAAGDAAVRLAFLHNVGDVALCLATAGAGAAMLLSGWFRIDAVVALAVAALLLAGAWRELPWQRRAVADQITSSSSLT